MPPQKQRQCGYHHSHASGCPTRGHQCHRCQRPPPPQGQAKGPRSAPSGPSGGRRPSTKAPTPPKTGMGRDKKSSSVCHSSLSMMTRMSVRNLMVIWLVSFLLALPAALAEHRIRVHDCRQPVNITAVASGAPAEPDPCITEPNAVLQEKEATFALLARENVQTLDGYRCTIRDTRTVSYCGNYDHSTPFAKFNYQNVPAAVSVRECSRMLRGEYTDPRGTSHKIEVGKVNILHYQSVGKTTATGNPINEIECVGDDFKVDGTTYGDMIVDHNLAVTIEKVKLKYSDGDLRAPDGLQLPCTPETQGCETAESTFTWNYHAHRCELGLSRTVRGMVVQDKATGKRVFMSTDGSLTRLIMQQPVSICRQIVYSTNYDKLFLYQIDKSRMHMPFTREVSPDAVSISTYINNRDDYLYNYIIDQITNEMGSVLVDNCRQQESQRRSTFFLRHHNPGLANFHAGGDTYATSAGEVLYYYRCRPLVAIPARLERCYDALPVRFNEQTRKENPRVKLTGIFFAEPLTHRLVTTAAEIPCSAQFPGKYEMIDGTWVKASPAIHATPMPTKPPEFLAKKPQFDRTIDWSKGGAYTQETMHNMELLMEMPRRRDALGVKMALQSRFQYDTPHLSAHNLFPEDPVTWFSGFASKFLRFLSIWGETAAIFTSLYFIWGMVKSLIEIVIGGKSIKEMEGCKSGLLMYICCPSAFLARRLPARESGGTGSSWIPSVFRKVSPAGRSEADEARIELAQRQRDLDRREAQVRAQTDELAAARTRMASRTTATAPVPSASSTPLMGRK